MRDIKELKIKCRTGPWPTEEDWRKFEEEYCVVVPELLRSLLSTANGGGLELNTIVPEGGSEGEMFGVNNFFHLKPGDDGTGSLRRAMKQWAPALGAVALPFARDGGGDVFFLDLTESPPSVKMNLHDPAATVRVAPSLEAFVDRLEVDPDSI